MILGGSENQVPNRIWSTTHQGSQVHHPYYEGDTHLKFNMWILNMMVLKGWKCIYIYILVIFYIHTHSSLQNIASLVYPSPPPLHAPPDWYQLGRHEYRSLRCQACSKDWIRGRIGGDQTGQCSFLLGKELYNLRKKSIPAILSSRYFVVRELGCYGWNIECEWLVAFRTWDLTKGTCHGGIDGRVFGCLSTDR